MFMSIKKWPHEFILAGTSKDRLNYNQHNVTKWNGRIFFHIYVSLFPHLKIGLGTWDRVNGDWPLIKTFAKKQHHTGCLKDVLMHNINNIPHFKVFQVTGTSFI